MNISNRILTPLFILKNIVIGFFADYHRAILKGRYFKGVYFKNKSKINIASTSYMEEGTWIWAMDSTETTVENVIIGNNCWLGKDVEIQTQYQSVVKLHDYVSVQDRCKILGSVSIGKYTLLAPDVFISSGNHVYNHKPQLLIKKQDRLLLTDAGSYENYIHEVQIEEDCWIGKNVIISPGVYVGRGAIVGTNAVVKNNVEPYSIVVGMPAKAVKKRIEFNPPNALSKNNIETFPYFYRGFNHLFEDNDEYILSERNNLVLLERTLTGGVRVEGFCFAENIKMNVFVNGILSKSETLLEGYFSQTYQINTSPESGSNAEYGKLPSFIQQFLCVQMEIDSNQTDSKYLLGIKTITLC